MSVPCGKKYENNYQQQPKTFIKLQLSRWTASKSGVFPQDVKAASPHRHGQGSLQESSSSSSFFFFSSSSLSAVCPAGPQGANQMAAWVSTVSRECGELLASLPPLFKFCEELHGSDRGAHRRSGWARRGGGGRRAAVSVWCLIHSVRQEETTSVAQRRPSQRSFTIYVRFPWGPPDFVRRAPRTQRAL